MPLILHEDRFLGHGPACTPLAQARIIMSIRVESSVRHNALALIAKQVLFIHIHLGKDCILGDTEHFFPQLLPALALVNPLGVHYKVLVVRQERLRNDGTFIGNQVEVKLRDFDFARKRSVFFIGAFARLFRRQLDRSAHGLSLQGLCICHVDDLHDSGLHGHVVRDDSDESHFEARVELFLCLLLHFIGTLLCKSH